MDYEYVHKQLDAASSALHQLIFDQQRDANLRPICDLAQSLIGIPVVWGGNTPEDGLDCSGVITYILRSTGIIEHNQDFNARTYALKFMRVISPGPGVIACYGKPVISHVMFCITSTLCIGAVGASKSIQTISAAIKAGAMVRMRNINYRSDLIKYVQPFEALYKD